MRITHGCTRIVILTEHLAIKIAFPFRPLVPFQRVWVHFRKGTLADNCRKKRGGLLKHALSLATIEGFYANRQEIRLVRVYPHYPLAPVLRSYLFGFIIVMPRGEAVTCVPPGWDRSCELPNGIETDLFLPYHVCRFGYEFKFVDFGGRNAEMALRALYG